MVVFSLPRICTTCCKRLSTNVSLEMFSQAAGIAVAKFSFHERR